MNILHFQSKIVIRLSIGMTKFPSRLQHSSTQLAGKQSRARKKNRNKNIPTINFYTLNIQQILTLQADLFVVHNKLLKFYTYKRNLYIKISIKILIILQH